MAHRTCGWHWAASLGLALLLTSAAAAQTPTAVLGIEPVDAPDELAVELSEALKLRVQRSAEYLLQSSKGLDEIKLVFGCMEEDPACMAKAGRTLQVQKMIWGTLRRVPAGFNLTIKLLDVESARVEKFVSENFSAAERQEAEVLIKRLTASFLAGKTGAVRITSSAPGARVLLDGRAVGIAGEAGLLVEGVEPGLHKVKVEREGYQPFAGQVAVISGQTVELSAELESQSEPPAVPPFIPPFIPTEEEEPATEPASRAGWQVAFWSSLAVSLGLATAAVTTGVQSWGYEEDLENLLVGTSLADRQRLFAADSTTSTEQYETLLASEIPDACAPPSGLVTVGELRDLCNKGSSRATLATGLWIAAGGVAVLSGVFGYLAFRAEEREAAPPRTGTTGLQWQLVPSLAPQAAALDFTLRF